MAAGPHSMPFGAQLQENGVAFRLWAPAASRVELCLGNEKGGEKRLSMNREPDGWYRTFTAQAGAGTRYSFAIDRKLKIPDPASRFQPEDVHGPSEVIDPRQRHWRAGNWHGRPWEEAVIYELHVGSFSPGGRFRGVQDRLDYLANLGVTCIELMPVADFPGAWNWGYDGVLPFAPDSRYGRPEQLAALVDAAHERQLMIILDVVYNHFGPEGNYLHHYAPAFFSRRHETPWGAAINFDAEDSFWVREFFIHNALFWLKEFQFDGLRLDAVHSINDDSRPDFLTELANRVRNYFGDRRHLHLLLENDNNAAHYLKRSPDGRVKLYTAQMNEDFHHSCHNLMTGESHGYYQDYADDPTGHLARCLSQGFAYQGEVSAFRDGRPRGEKSGHLPPLAFVNFLQNHDQVGNRALGERLSRLTQPQALHVLTTLLLLSPCPPLLFMGQEWACDQPFNYFSDLEPQLSEQVRLGRLREFCRLSTAAAAAANDPAGCNRPEGINPEDSSTATASIPDPAARKTFAASILDWSRHRQSGHGDWLEIHRRLIRLRQTLIVPHLASISGRQRAASRLSGRGLIMRWSLSSEVQLTALINVSDLTVSTDASVEGQLIYATHDPVGKAGAARKLPPWSASWFLHTGQE